jgi:thiosulfate/3-mercaptopyruvate sulfurtransferase
MKVGTSPRARRGVGGYALAAVRLSLAVAVATPAAAQTPRLISSDSLAVRLEQGPVAVVDVRQSWVSYLQGHLPGAAWLNVETLRAQQGELPFQLLPAAHYAELFRRLGLSPSRPVVVYSSGDQMDIDATFAAWLLASAGATEVLLLDGGFAKWEVEGRAVTQRYPRATVPRERFRPGAFHPSVASLADVIAAVGGSGALLVDARPGEQYSGSAGAQLRRGHIPGARSHPWKDDLEKPDLVVVWKSVEQLRAAYVAQGITADRDIILYCNSSTEASHVFFALKYLLGYPRVRVFTGAWSQWSEREDLPLER